MTAAGWSLLVAYSVVLTAIAWPLARWIDHVTAGRFRGGLAVEALFYRAAGVRADTSQGWLAYALSLLLFNAVGLLALYALQRLQHLLPLNPTDMAAVAPDLAFNTAISFVTNTNWQSYAGEATMAYLTQMLGLTVQNFLSAATGIAVAIALIRGLAAHSSKSIGNAWVDLTRITLWILLPFSALLALVFVSQGVVQTLSPTVEARLLEPVTYDAPRTGDDGAPVLDAQGNPVMETKQSATQAIAVGPLASQIAIKMLGTNGGGFFNANSAHPFENPTALSNFVQMLAILVIPAALCFVFGRQVGDRRQGWAVFAAMGVLFVGFAIAALVLEQQGTPMLRAAGADMTASELQPGGNMEGKEARFGIVASTLFAVITTAASCGAVNAMHDSFTPLGGAVPLALMQLGEVVFGGVGSGLYGMLVFALLTVFIAGLMVGRTPEHLGKKIEAFEMKMISVAILMVPLLVLAGTAVAVSVAAGRAGIQDPGAHGFTEVLYAFSSAANNNGSAFAGLSANTPFYNVALGLAMWFGRFGVIVPVLAIAGALAAKPRIAAGEGTLPTHGGLFVTMLVSTVLLVGLLNYVPALALGPVVEHLGAAAAAAAGAAR